MGESDDEVLSALQAISGALRDKRDDGKAKEDEAMWNQFISLGQNNVTGNQPLAAAPGPALQRP